MEYLYNLNSINKYSLNTVNIKTNIKKIISLKTQKTTITLLSFCMQILQKNQKRAGPLKKTYRSMYIQLNRKKKNHKKNIESNHVH